jgi:putative DNA primase/helicase
MTEKIGDESIYLRVNELIDGKIQLTDSTNAERLYKEHGRDIRYFPAWKKWLVWNGKKWVVDEGAAMVQTKGLKTIRNIYSELLKTNDYRERYDIENYAKICESTKRHESIIRNAQWIEELHITSDDLDPSPWLLNVHNGTIDMKKNEYREHRQEDMMTKIANVEYDPNADCPLWKQFIREIMDYKPELITFLQTAVGWALTGNTTEQTMFILYGSGANGKSTFLNTIMHLLGDYATATPTETFMKSQEINIRMILPVCVVQGLLPQRNWSMGNGLQNP